MDVTAAESTRGPGPGEPRAAAADGDVPEPGAPVTLLPTGRADLLTGRLVTWSADLDRAQVDAIADVSPHEVHGICGEKVWASVRTAATNSLLAFSAEARAADDPHQVRLAGRLLAREPRREAVRAPAQLHVTLTLPRGTAPECAGHTLDVSRVGCRVALDQADQLEAGQRVRAAITLHGASYAIATRVERVEPPGRVVGLRFLDLPPDAAEALDRLAFESLG